MGAIEVGACSLAWHRARAAGRRRDEAHAGVLVLASFAAVLLSLLFATPARAAPSEAVGVVVAVEGEDVFVDVGRVSGGVAGTKLEVRRTLKARHPGSGRRLEEDFAVATIEIAEAGAVLARGRAVSQRKAPLVGDLVVFVDPPRRPTPARPVRATTPEPVELLLIEPPPARACPPPRPDPAAPLVSTFAASAGRPLAERLAAWQALLGTELPAELYEPVRREIAALHAEAAQLREAQERRIERLASPIAVGPTRLIEGERAVVTIALPDGAALHDPRLWYRPEGAAGFSSVPMTGAGDGFLRAELPEAAVRAPGVAWFAAATGPRGEVTLASEPGSPQWIGVEPDPLAPPERKDRSRVALYAEDVSFDGVHGEERFSRYEASFLYRVLSPALYGVSLGFGSYDGRGGTPEELARGESDPVRLHYGTAALEWHASEAFGLIGRGLAGNGPEGLATGLEGQLRIGRERGTSLVVGASTADTMGDAASLQLSWDTVPGLPMSGQVFVLDLPGDEELRVRLVHEVRRAIGEHVELALRTSYNARDADHGGLGLGLGTVFSW